jgi:hypothetical protein
VQHRQTVAEARAQAAENLMGQCDLGNQHQGLPPDAEGVGHRAQVDLGLAASCHAVEQEGLGAALGHRRADLAAGDALLLGQGKRGHLLASQLD